MTIIAIGPHPDDPEEGAGGTLVRLTKMQERLIIIYVTGGGKGIQGKKSEEAVKIRTAEAQAACKLIGAEPLFLGLDDGHCFPSEKAIQQLQEIFEKEEPKAILTCWPLDTHSDHRATAFMVMEAYTRTFGSNFNSTMGDPLDIHEPKATEPMKFPGLFFWSTELFHQSLQFHPQILINIDATIDKKMELVEAHESQNRNDNLVKWVEKDAKILANLSGGSVQFVEGFMPMRSAFL